MTQEDRPIRQSRSQTFHWVAIVAGMVVVVFALVDGQILRASAWTALVLAMLVEATKLDERSAAAKRLGEVLTAVFVPLPVFYLYTVIVS